MVCHTYICTCTHTRFNNPYNVIYSVEFDADEGLNTFEEDIYEHEIRLPFTGWGHHEAYWADVVSVYVHLPMTGLVCVNYPCCSVVTSLLDVMTSPSLVIKLNAQKDGSGLHSGK